MVTSGGELGGGCEPSNEWLDSALLLVSGTEDCSVEERTEVVSSAGALVMCSILEMAGLNQTSRLRNDECDTMLLYRRYSCLREIHLYPLSSFLCSATHG